MRCGNLEPRSAKEKQPSIARHIGLTIIVSRDNFLQSNSLSSKSLHFFMFGPWRALADVICCFFLPSIVRSSSYQTFRNIESDVDIILILHDRCLTLDEATTSLDPALTILPSTVHIGHNA